MTQLNYWWDTWNSGTSSYGTPEAIISNTCAYEVSTGTSNLNRGLKTTSDFYFRNPSDHSPVTLDHEDQYGEASTGSRRSPAPRRSRTRSTMAMGT